MRRLLAPVVAAIWTVAAAAFFYGFLKEKVPFQHAFFFDVVKLVAATLFLNVGWLCSGAFVLERLRLTRMPPIERLALAGPLGAAVFLLGLWLFGAVRALGPVVGVLWPLLLIAVGGPSARRMLSSVVARWRRTAVSSLELACFTAGVLVLGLVWTAVLTPESVNYDATWNHLVIAQDYAREGRIFGFRADWVKNLPHAGSLINTWAFLVPGLEPAPLRWLLALQLEFFALLWTLVGVSAVASRMLLHRAPRALWASIVLFPAILVYDSNLGAAADHYLALFACAVLLAGLKFARRFDRRWAVVAGAVLGVAFATKLQAAFMAAPVAVLLGVALLRRRRSWRQALPGVGIFAAAAFAMILPHLIRNTVAFHNPLYPLAQGLLGGTPTVPDAAVQMTYLFADWRTHPPSFWPRLSAAASMLATFSFQPHYSFVRDLPMFGSLFTLLTPALLFVHKRRPHLLIVLMSYGALFTWAMLVWVDRNLQAIAPWLWAATAGLCVGVWRLGWPARVGLALLVTIQVGWALGMYASGNDRIFAGLRLFQTQTAPSQEGRWAPYHARNTELDRTLPKDAVVLLHNSHVMLGINRTVLLDWIGFQGLFDYRPMSSVTDLFESLAAQQVTHVAWRPWARFAASKQEDVLFAALVMIAAPHTEDRSGLAVFDLSRLKVPARPEKPWRVLTFGVVPYTDGTYELTQLATCEEYPPELKKHPPPLSPFPAPADLEQVLSQVDVVLTADENQLPPQLRTALMNGQWISAGPRRVFVRRTALGL